MKSIISLFFLLFLFTTLQAQNVVFIFNAPEGEEIIILNEDKHEKSVDFQVSGLNTSEEVADLVEKISATSGVKSFTISDEVINNVRAASGVFEACGSLVYFRDLLTNNGIENVIVNGESIKSVDLQTVWKSYTGEESPTQPNPFPED